MCTYNTCRDKKLGVMNCGPISCNPQFYPQFIEHNNNASVHACMYAPNYNPLSCIYLTTYSTTVGTS